jgi:hypothetical protein
MKGFLCSQNNGVGKSPWPVSEKPRSLGAGAGLICGRTAGMKITGLDKIVLVLDCFSPIIKTLRMHEWKKRFPNKRALITDK